MGDPEKRITGASDTLIDQLRISIDEIDEKILDLINNRLRFAGEIGKVKEQSGSQILDISREGKILQRLMSSNKGPLNSSALACVFKEIFAASRQIQQHQRVAYLGPEATFTHAAALNFFGHSTTYEPQSSIRDIFKQVEKGTYHYGVVPVENSIEGAVNYTLDLLFESDLKICAEIYRAVSHDLLSKSGMTQGIQVIYSHPHAFAQCRKWLEKYFPEVTLEECTSTAEAARKAADKRGSAAIASKEAAKIYGLRVAVSGIEDTNRNITRFLVIGRDEAHQTGYDKTSIMFVTAHVPGALYKVLKPIGEAGINMVKLESRPARFENWNYCFFVDLEGHMENPLIRETVEKMKHLCLHLKHLGSYPRAQN
jgi:chorismate mutase/prephenate dehydratase